MRLSILAVPFRRFAIEGPREFPGALTSTVQRRDRPHSALDVPHFARPLSVEAIGERELSAALAPEACAFRVPHRERSAKHRSISALLAHEDDPPRRTVHLPAPSSALETGQQIGTREASTTSTLFELTQALVHLRSIKRKFRFTLTRPPPILSKGGRRVFS